MAARFAKTKRPEVCPAIPVRKSVAATGGAPFEGARLEHTIVSYFGPSHAASTLPVPATVAIVLKVGNAKHCAREYVVSLFPS